MYPTTQLSPESARPINGKYIIEREIGRGGMGIVYRAMHVGLERPVALKVVLPELAHNEMVVQRMLEEARCAAQITSVHVVRVLDVGQLDTGAPFIVMDLVEGEDVARAVARDGIPPLEIAVRWVIEASVAIAEAHEKGIVHRDLKPENLFVARGAGAARLIKVLDFGISKRLDRAAPRSVTRPHELIGSPHYMAPEQIRAPLSVDARADIWALGVILIELVTGRRAFGGDTLASVCANVLGSEPELPETALPAELLVALRRAVRKDPNERFQDVAELAAASRPCWRAAPSRCRLLSSTPSREPPRQRRSRREPPRQSRSRREPPRQSRSRRELTRRYPLLRWPSPSSRRLRDEWDPPPALTLIPIPFSRSRCGARHRQTPSQIISHPSAQRPSHRPLTAAARPRG